MYLHNIFYVFSSRNDCVIFRIFPKLRLNETIIIEIRTLVDSVSLCINVNFNFEAMVTNTNL